MQKTFSEIQSGQTQAERQRDFKLAAVSALATFLLIAVPRISPLIVVCLTLAITGFLLRKDFQRDELRLDFARLASRPEVLFVLWIFVACLWSAKPDSAVGKATFFALLVLHAFYLASQRDRLPKDVVSGLSKGLLAGFILAGLFVCSEIVTRDGIVRFVLTHFPDLDRGFSKHMIVKDGVVEQATGANITRSSAIFCLFLCPAALAAAFYTQGVVKWVAYALLALFSFTIYFHPHTHSQAAQLSIPAVAAVFGLATISMRLTKVLVGTGYAVLALFIVPISIAMFSAGLHMNESLFSSGRARVIIWNYTAERVLENPILGVGTNSTRYIDDARLKANEITTPEGFVAAPATRAHPHNIFLQVWYELGVVGALAFTYLGLSILNRIDLAPRKTREFLIAQFAMCMTLITPTYGLWQAWFQSAFVLSILALILMSSSIPDNASSRSGAAPV